MGVFSKWSKRGNGDRQGGSCTCPEHIGALLDLEVPARVDGESQGPESVRELLAYVWVDEWQYGEEPLDPEEVEEITEELLPGFTHLLGLGDEVAGHYDDDAPLPLDESLKTRPGIRDVAWEDREVLHVKAPGMCAEGVMAALARAVLDPRVRLTPDAAR